MKLEQVLADCLVELIEKGLNEKAHFTGSWVDIELESDYKCDETDFRLAITLATPAIVELFNVAMLDRQEELTSTNVTKED